MTYASISPEPCAVDEFEARIADVWTAVLDDTVDDYDRNFLDAGGTSLKMMRVHVELMRVLDRQIPITTMFEFPSISALAAHLAQTPAEAPVVQAAAPMRAAGMRRKFRAYKK
jgi:acyl carrier protein